MTAIVAPAPARDRRNPLARALLSDWFVLWLSLAYFVALLPFLPTLGHPGEPRQPPLETPGRSSSWRWARPLS
jgi:hypothetical protein